MLFLKLSPVFLVVVLMGISNIPQLVDVFGIQLDLGIVSFLAVVWAAIVSKITMKKSVNEVIEDGLNAVREAVIVYYILMLAYAMGEVFMYSGVGASLVQFFLKLGISGKTVAVVSLLTTSVLSVATGTSWGTFAACAPIFLWLSHIVGGDAILTMAAICGGSCFGDNIGLISDTTVVSSAMQDVEVVHRVRHQGVWSLLCLVASSVVFYLVSLHLPGGEGVDVAASIQNIPQNVMEVLAVERPGAVVLLEQIQSGVSYLMAIPLFVVIGTAIAGIPTILCLLLGLLSSYICGSITGTISSFGVFLDHILSGFSDAGSWIIVIGLWIVAFGGIMQGMKAFDPIAHFMARISKSVKQLMFYNGVLTLIGTASLADDMAEIVTISPIIRQITEENVEGDEKSMYKLALRNSTFADAMAVFGSQLVPWHVYMSYFVGLGLAIYPLGEFTALKIIGRHYMAWIVVGSMLLLTLTGLDRFIPLFALPREPEGVRLVKNKKDHSDGNNQGAQQETEGTVS